MLAKEDYFKPISPEEQKNEFIALQNKSFARDAWERFSRNKRALTGFVVLVIIILAAVFGPHISPFAYDGMDSEIGNQPPSAIHWFGTDRMGRDLLVRVFYGVRISLLIGFVTTAINVCIGVVYGGFAGYLGGKLDLLMMRIVDIIYAIPVLLYIILIMLILGANVKSIMIGICISGWIDVSRIMRAQVISLKERDFSLAAYIQGASPLRILFRHLIKNAMGPVIVKATLMIPQAIFMEAFLSFIGIGISAPEASLGSLAQSSRMYLEVYPYQMIFPICTLSVIIFALNFIGEGLNEALNPRGKR